MQFADKSELRPCAAAREHCALHEERIHVVVRLAPDLDNVDANPPDLHVLDAVHP